MRTTRRTLRRDHPSHEVAQAAAELDGDSLAGQPALIARAAKEIVALRPGATADDVLIYAAGLASRATA